ncbi:MAG: azurin [Lysobacterales bacterium RIFOXYD1_FULL_69_11]|nr:MAG: azurin [Xanthomonadales bacterium RIFOXYA1_FULL_69_10]OHE87480.1 MAG: azurin [Xanthomonadales bacterium RIFOXYD1_FULL_69_11]
MSIRNAFLALAVLGAASTAQAANRCTIDLKGDDRMQFSTKSVTVSAACPRITIRLAHTGKLPAKAMGHNVVVSATPDVQALSAAGIKAGAANHYAPKGDKRVLAVTPVIGGGETTTAIIPAGRLKAGGQYSFFCSFPGHAALMKGTLVVTK